MRTATVERARKWHLADVLGQFETVARLADKHGMLASLFGSTLLFGVGNDLDVLMTARKDQEARVDEFLAEFGGIEVCRKERQEKGIFSVKVVKCGRYYDFAFMKVSEDRGRGI